MSGGWLAGTGLRSVKQVEVRCNGVLIGDDMSLQYVLQVCPPRPALPPPAPPAAPCPQRWPCPCGREDTLLLCTLPSLFSLALICTRCRAAGPDRAGRCAARRRTGGGGEKTFCCSTAGWPPPATSGAGGGAAQRKCGGAVLLSCRCRWLSPGDSRTTKHVPYR